MNFFCRRSSVNNDRSKDDKSQQFHVVVGQATILRFLYRKTAEICELKLLFCIGKLENIVHIWCT